MSVDPGNTSPEYKAQCEARQWIYWIRLQGKDAGAAWKEKKRVLVKRRGQEAVDKLIGEMTRQREILKKQR